MRKISAAAACMVFVAAFACAAFASGKPKYSAYSSKIDAFSVEVPTAFKTFEFIPDTIDTKHGKRSFNAYNSLGKDSGYQIIAINYGVRSLSPEYTRSKLEEARKKTSGRGTVISKNDAKLDGNFALKLRDKISADGVSMYSDTVFSYIDGRLFQISFLAADKGKLDGADAKHFFSSFKYSVKK
jgi:hypothetical protein